ncbi:MAG: sigma-70 family RNA polymerase sigma factor [Oscillospiraceae bacterium]|nr:sigma-70 family RNA polymerase sigma factor [Oscillospiraceae bacterium]
MLLFLLSTLSDEADRRALYDLYKQYQNAMLRVARRYFPNDTDAAEDAVQSAWLRVVESFSRIFEIPCQKRGAYLVIIVKNESITMLRRRGREVPLDETLAEENGSDDSASVIEMIRAMPETYRAALEMRFVEEMSTREIAAALCISEDAASARISRGRRLLTEKLRKEGYTV